jgi:hypothetical protein
MRSDFEITDRILDRAIVAYELINDSPHGVKRAPMSAALDSAIYDSGLVQEVLNLREALEFYADPNAWNQPPVKTKQGWFTVEYENQASKMQVDRGKRAREALKESVL